MSEIQAINEDSAQTACIASAVTGGLTSFVGITAVFGLASGALIAVLRAALELWS